MTWPNGETRAYVVQNYNRFRSIGIYLVTGLPNGNTAIGVPFELAWQELAGDERGIEHGPTLTLPDDVGRALLEALSQHYGGVADMRQNRDDLLAERKRVDLLIDVVSKVALAEPTVDHRVADCIDRYRESK